MCAAHGMSHTKLYKVWSNMIHRCHNPNSISFKYYGGRGISVCEKWRGSFVAFRNDVGEPKAGLQLDRFPNKLGNYEPGNVRWATPKQNGRNRTNNLLVRFRGKLICVSELAERLKISVSSSRKKAGFATTITFQPTKAVREKLVKKIGRRPKFGVKSKAINAALDVGLPQVSV